MGEIREICLDELTLCPNFLPETRFFKDLAATIGLRTSFGANGTS